MTLYDPNKRIRNTSVYGEGTQGFRHSRNMLKARLDSMARRTEALVRKPCTEELSSCALFVSSTGALSLPLRALRALRRSLVGPATFMGRTEHDVQGFVRNSVR